MNNTMPIGMKSELDEIKSEVRSLHNTMGKLVKLTTRLLTRLKGIEGIRLYLDLRSTATGERAPARRKGTAFTRTRSNVYPIAVAFFATGNEEAS